MADGSGSRDTATRNPSSSSHLLGSGPGDVDGKDSDISSEVRGVLVGFCLKLDLVHLVQSFFVVVIRPLGLLVLVQTLAVGSVHCFYRLHTWDASLNLPLFRYLFW
jgi:hypothetical protein